MKNRRTDSVSKRDHQFEWVQKGRKPHLKQQWMHIQCKLEICPLSLKRSLQSPSISVPSPVCQSSFIMLAKYRLSSVCKEILMKAKVCQKVTSKWLEACDFQYCVLWKCQEWYILMSGCTEGLFSFSD